MLFLFFPLLGHDIYSVGGEYSCEYMKTVCPCVITYQIILFPYKINKPTFVLAYVMNFSPGKERGEGPCHHWVTSAV